MFPCCVIDTKFSLLVYHVCRMRICLGPCVTRDVDVVRHCFIRDWRGGCPSLRTNRREGGLEMEGGGTWVPACAGMTVGCRGYVGSRLRGKDGWGAGVTWVPACAGKTGGGAGVTWVPACAGKTGGVRGLRGFPPARERRVGCGGYVGSRLRGKDGWGRRGNDGWGVLAAYVAPLT